MRVSLEIGWQLSFHFHRVARLRPLVTPDKARLSYARLGRGANCHKTFQLSQPRTQRWIIVNFWYERDSHTTVSYPHQCSDGGRARPCIYIDLTRRGQRHRSRRRLEEKETPGATIAMDTATAGALTHTSAFGRRPNHAAAAVVATANESTTHHPLTSVL